MIYENITKLCKDNETSIRKLEIACGIGHGTINHWKEPPKTLKNIQKVAEFFNVPVDELVK